MTSALISKKANKKLIKDIITINYLHKQYSQYKDEEIKRQFQKLKEHKVYNIHVRCQVFALVKEVISRLLHIQLHDEQVMAGLVLAEGKVAEVATGEGKTVMSVLPACWFTLQGKKVHMMTVNDYLAKRDYEEMGKVFHFFGITIGLNHAKLPMLQKKQAYAKDITYGVCSEFGFDYLKDHLVRKKEDFVQSPLEVVIVDEIDSILIDEAKTPLIISEKQKTPPDLYKICSRLVSRMKEGKDYEIDLKMNQVIYTDCAIKRLETILMIDNLYDGEHAHIFHFLLQSLRAHVFMKRDEHYIVKDAEIQLIDAFTGRILEGRQYNDGLHQAIEAKEEIPLSEENRVKAMITIQKLFSLYDTVVGMTGTIQTEQEEIYDLYGIEVVVVPTHKPVIREDVTDSIFRTKREKYEAVVEDIKATNSQGQPVLVGTTSVDQSEKLANLLRKEKISFQLLNAKTEQEEAAMIANAGQQGMITISTNMAGRGTDIKLGDGVRELGGLYVIGTEKHESRRIDRQLRGRAGRQGDPGKSKFFLSLEDELVVRFASDRILKWEKRLLKESEFTKIQQEAEEQNFAIRTIVYLLDSVIHEQRILYYHHRKNIVELHTFVQTIKNHIYMYQKDLEVSEKLSVDLLHDRNDKELDLDTIGDILTKELSKNELNQLYNKYIILLDERWANHIDKLYHLKQSLHSRIYEQRDPILIFHDEAWKLYYAMEKNIREEMYDHFIYFLRGGDKNGTTLGSSTDKAISY